MTSGGTVVPVRLGRPPVVKSAPAAQTFQTGDGDVAAPATTTHPFVSIVMPIRNEVATVRAAVATALAQVLAEPFEVVVVDGMSDDGSRPILDALAIDEPRLRIIENPGRGTAQAMNRGLEAAAGTFWVRVDGHSEIPTDYVARLVEHLRAGEADAAGGVVKGLGRSPFGRAVAAAHDSRFGIGNARHHYGRQLGPIDHVTHGVYRLDLTRSIGGFDESLVRNQDYDFDWRYSKAGGRILLDPSVTFHRGVRETPSALARQFYEYGYWKQVVLRRHPASIHARWLAPPALVASLGVGLAFAWTRPGRSILCATAATYAGVVVSGAGTIARRNGPELAPRAALALATMHVAWGAGFLRSAISRAR